MEEKQKQKAGKKTSLLVLPSPDIWGEGPTGASLQGQWAPTQEEENNPNFMCQDPSTVRGSVIKCFPEKPSTLAHAQVSSVSQSGEGER